MKKLLLFSFVLISLISNQNFAQSFDGVWSCLYATTDDGANGTGYNTSAVGVLSVDEFVALVNRGAGNACYLVSYKNADSTNGRLESFDYGDNALVTTWVSGFDQTDFSDANDLAIGPDNLIYVINNDVEKSVLIFQMTEQGAIPADYRLATGSSFGSDFYTWSIDVDDLSRVYVTRNDTTTGIGKVMIYDNKENEAAWTPLSGATPTPLQEIEMSVAGDLRGIAVNPEGTVMYVSNYATGQVLCYTGSPESGYSLNPAFSFTLLDTLISTTTGDTLVPGPWGMKFMPEKNILFVACDVDFILGSGYEYGKILALNPNTGEKLSEIDVAKWNFDMTGNWSSRTGGTTPGNVSGYTSTFDVDFDEEFNIYSQSYYGWTVEKWQFSGTIPTIPLTITSVEREEGVIPTDFSLSQNYPNPFNPSTVIEFTIEKSSNVSLNVYSVTGELVSRLVDNAYMESGKYHFTFDASKMAAGTYIYELSNGTQSISKKMILVK